MLKVAVTGGIGSGKSSVCRVLAARRIPVLRADELSKQIASKDAGARRDIRRLLGPEAYRSNGSLNRSFVAAEVFGHPRLLKRLESVLHPRVLRGVRAWFRAQAAKGRDVAVVEAALVFESGLDRLVDIVVVVDAPRTVRVRRLRTRDNVPAADIRRRMAAQMPDGERRKRAHILLKNDGQRRLLVRRTTFLARFLRELSNDT